MKNLKNRVFFPLLLVTFGYLISRFVNFPYFELSRTIDISNIFTLVATVFVAIVVTTVFEKQNVNHRVEKDLIIRRVGSVHDIAALLQMESSSGKIAFTEASSSLKRINGALNSVYKIVDKCHFSITEDTKDSIKNCLGDLRTTLTNTPSVSSDQLNSKDLPIEIRDSIVYYNTDRISQIEVKFDTLKDLLLELQIEINKK